MNSTYLVHISSENFMSWGEVEPTDDIFRDHNVDATSSWRWCGYHIFTNCIVQFHISDDIVILHSVERAYRYGLNNQMKTPKLASPDLESNE